MNLKIFFILLIGIFVTCVTSYLSDGTSLENFDDLESNSDYMKRYSYLKGGIRWKKPNYRNNRYLKGGIRWKRRNYLKGGLRF
uniref:1020HH-1 protein n=1 Tax=Schmidtea mediterranea TaxID=79327 RepID=E3T7U2_SCHMD|nr:1020HH-1 protein [Schmidtea mediterranea]